MRARALIRTLAALAVASVPIGLAPLACSPTSGGTPPATDAAPACPSDLPAACPSPAPAYQANVLPVIERRCWACHGDGGIEVMAHDFGTYDKIYQERRSILTQVYGCLMPLPDAAPLLPDERAALLGWLVCGAPND